MKNNTGIMLGIVIVIITTLLGIIIGLLNIPVSWIVCDNYEEYRECYKVNTKYIDYLEGNGKEYYSDIRRIDYGTNE